MPSNHEGFSSDLTAELERFLSVFYLFLETLMLLSVHQSIIHKYCAAHQKGHSRYLTTFASRSGQDLPFCRMSAVGSQKGPEAIFLALSQTAQLLAGSGLSEWACR